MKRKPRILVVEDEKSLCLLYREELEKEGYQVTTVQDTASAVEAVDRTEFDLIISDIRLPGPNGLEFIQRVLGQRKDMPIIINTAYQSYMADFASWAADAYLVKSGSLHELKAKVRELLAKADVAN